MLEVSLDIETRVVVAMGPAFVPSPQELVALIRQHRNLACETQASLRMEGDGIALQRVERDAHRAVMIVRPDRDHGSDALERIGRPLQRAHPAEGTSDRDLDTVDAQLPERATLRSDDIGDRNARKASAVWCAVRRKSRRPGRAGSQLPSALTPITHHSRGSKSPPSPTMPATTQQHGSTP